MSVTWGSEKESDICRGCIQLLLEVLVAPSHSHESIEGVPDMLLQGPKPLRSAATLALHSNIKDLKKEFPLATFNLTTTQDKEQAPVDLISSCPSGMRSVIRAKMQQAVKCIEAGQSSIDTSTVDRNHWRQITADGSVAEMRKQLAKDFGVYVMLNVDTTKRSITLTTLKVVMPGVERKVKLWLGLSAPPTGAPTGAAAPALSHEQRALQLLQVNGASSLHELHPSAVRTHDHDIQSLA